MNRKAEIVLKNKTDYYNGAGDPAYDSNPGQCVRIGACDRIDEQLLYGGKADIDDQLGGKQNNGSHKPGPVQTGITD
ncbi:hypothetical protein D3C81_2039800 [compost metagenome]